jgi:hypothetical protein
MNVKLFLLILFLFASCGKPTDFVNGKGYPKKHKTHSDFYPYVDLFEQYYGEIKTPIIYGNAEKDENWVGKCTVWSSGYREITIDKTYWENIGESARQQLILHELGHCKFNRDHNNNFFDNGCPNSVMTSYVFSYSNLENCFVPDFVYYVNELLK